MPLEKSVFKALSVNSKRRMDRNKKARKADEKMEMNTNAPSIFNQSPEDQQSATANRQETDTHSSIVGATAEDTPEQIANPGIDLPISTFLSEDPGHTAAEKSTTAASKDEQAPPFSLPEQRFTASWTFEEQTQAQAQKRAKRRTRKSQTRVKEDVKISPSRPSPAAMRQSGTPRLMRDERRRVVMERPSVWEDVALVIFLLVAVAALLWVVYEGVDRFWS
jgi:hypothetical protein